MKCKMVLKTNKIIWLGATIILAVASCWVPVAHEKGEDIPLWAFSLIACGTLFSQQFDLAFRIQNTIFVCGIITLQIAIGWIVQCGIVLGATIRRERRGKSGSGPDIEKDVGTDKELRK